jgi:hypothetical protein
MDFAPSSATGWSEYWASPFPGEAAGVYAVGLEKQGKKSLAWYLKRLVGDELSKSTVGLYQSLV